jgi:hypothetical protein
VLRAEKVRMLNCLLGSVRVVGDLGVAAAQAVRVEGAAGRHYGAREGEVGRQGQNLAWGPSTHGGRPFSFRKT